jgi:hypothetical protein
MMNGPMRSLRSLFLGASAAVFFAGTVSSVCACACAARNGYVPMAGSTNPSTLCVFGMRGVRAAVDDCDSVASGSLDVTLTMSANTRELRRRAHALIENAGYVAGSTEGMPFPHPAPLQTPAQSVVDDVPGGVRIHVTPRDPGDLEALRDEIEARIERASDGSRCN